jgi:hypothetical protein
MILQILALIVLGLMCECGGVHPLLNRQPLAVHIPVCSAFAKLFGRIMPYWMAGCALLILLLLLPFEHLNPSVWHLFATAFIIQIATVVFSLVAPVPINTRITTWVSSSLPSNWREEDRRWDIYHWFRTSGLMWRSRCSRSAWPRVENWTVV